MKKGSAVLLSWCNDKRGREQNIRKESIGKRDTAMEGRGGGGG